MLYDSVYTRYTEESNSERQKAERQSPGAGEMRSYCSDEYGVSVLQNERVTEMDGRDSFTL